MPDRFTAEESDPSYRSSHLLEGVRLSRLCDHEFGDGRLWPSLPARRRFVHHRSHWQILSGHKDLLEIDLRRSLDDGARRRRDVRVPKEYIRRAEREHRNGPDNDQLPVHETTPFGRQPAIAAI